MGLPYGICFIKNRVYVSQAILHSIQIYTLDGVFMDQAGCEGSSKEEFKSPSGIASNANKNLIYVCDTNNHRVQLLNQHLSFVNIIGHGLLRKPIDVNINYYGGIVVLDKNVKSCIHIFSPSGQHLNDMISIESCHKLTNPLHFTIYSDYYYALSDYNSSAILMFNWEGHQITHAAGNIFLKEPKGIAWDGIRKVFIVATNEETNSLIILK